METGSPLVRLAAKYFFSILTRTPGATGVWDGIRFTVDDVEECDYLIVINNNRPMPIKVRCPRSHVWCVMQEPYVPGYHDWMIERHENFARVFTNHVPKSDPKYIRSHPALPWWVSLSYDELVALNIPDKTRGISYIASNLNWLPGHRKRNALRQFLLQAAPGKVDIFGRGVRPLDNKWDGLAPYRYSIVIENSNGPDYWTEKIADCFLAWTLPLYDGCPNLEDYFPADSFIRIDGSDPHAVLATVNGALRSDEWERRLPAIQEARCRVLQEYGMFPSLARLIRSYGSDDRERSSIEIPAYPGMHCKNKLRYTAHRFRERIRNRELPSFLQIG
jgi:hypothetical protein